MKIIDEAFLREVAIKFSADYAEKCEANKRFWESDLCKKMIYDVIEKKEPLCDETFRYEPDAVKNMFGWVDITDHDVSMFFDVMSDSSLGVDVRVTVDEECPFENFSIRKNGLCCDVMIGQGTSYTIYSAALPDM